MTSLLLCCVNFQNDSTTETYVMDERDFVRFEFKMSFGRICNIAPPTPSHTHARMHTRTHVSTHTRMHARTHTHINLFLYNIKDDKDTLTEIRVYLLYKSSVYYSETTWAVGIAQLTHHEVQGGGKNPETGGRGIFAPTANRVVS